MVLKILTLIGEKLYKSVSINGYIHGTDEEVGNFLYNYAQFYNGKVREHIEIPIKHKKRILKYTELVEQVPEFILSNYPNLYIMYQNIIYIGEHYVSKLIIMLSMKWIEIVNKRFNNSFIQYHCLKHPEPYNILDIYNFLQPVFKVEDKFYIIAKVPFNNIKQIAYMWNAPNYLSHFNLINEELDEICVIPTFHSATYGGSFKPDFYEVICQLPSDLEIMQPLFITTRLEEEEEKLYLIGAYYVATTRIYRSKKSPIRVTL